MLINPQSNYYDIPCLNKVLTKLGSNAISFLHCNIQSLSKNINLLEDTLCSLSIIINPDILAITETRLNVNAISNVELPNYSIFHTDS